MRTAPSCHRTPRHGGPTPCHPLKQRSRAARYSRSVAATDRVTATPPAHSDASAIPMTNAATPTPSQTPPTPENSSSQDQFFAISDQLVRNYNDTKRPHSALEHDLGEMHLTKDYLLFAKPAQSKLFVSQRIRHDLRNIRPSAIETSVRQTRVVRRPTACAHNKRCGRSGECESAHAA